MNNTAFTYYFKTTNEVQFLCIIDNDNGKSVTNNIENVVKWIATEEQIDPASVVIIYQDTDGMWDGWSHQQQNFFSLNATSANRAIENYFTNYKKQAK